MGGASRPKQPAVAFGIAFRGDLVEAFADAGNDVELGKGKKVTEICKLLEVTEQTYYRWRQKYGV